MKRNDQNDERQSHNSTDLTESETTLLDSAPNPQDDEEKPNEKNIVAECSTELVIEESVEPAKKSESEKNINWNEIIGEIEDSNDDPDEGELAEHGEKECYTPTDIINNVKWKEKLEIVLKEKKHFVIGILDSGINLNIIAEYPHIKWKCFPNESAVIDTNGHGTAVASIIAELVKDFTDKGEEVSVTIWIIKVSDNDNKNIKLNAATNGLKQALELGCDIINLSWTFKNSLGKVMQKLLYDQLIVCDKKAQIFMASGNLLYESTSQSSALIPALWANELLKVESLKNSFCVTALGVKGQIYKSCCSGNNLNCIIAPGCIYINGKEWKGTSFAAPTAIAAYIRNGGTKTFQE